LPAVAFGSVFPINAVRNCEVMNVPSVAIFVVQIDVHDRPDECACEVVDLSTHSLLIMRRPFHTPVQIELTQF
jgi:hypothetical protein